jgi:hypothetical protein
MTLKYLVTGTARSGTVFMARLLTSVGVPCAHEAVFGYDGLQMAKRRLLGEKPIEPSWVSQSRMDKGQWEELERWMPDAHQIVAESSYMAAPFLADACLSGVRVIHVVRDPIKVVNSLCNYLDYFRSPTPQNRYEEFVYERLPELAGDMGHYDRAALYWARWNRMVVAPALFHRVEDGPDPVLAFLGVTGTPFADTAVNSFKKPTSERFTINKIKSKAVMDEFLSLGVEYGYTMKSDYLLV